MSSKVLIVVDYQGCFLPGGGLATNQGPAPVTGDKDGRRIAKAAEYFSVEMASVAAVAKNANNVNNASKWQQGGKRKSRSVITRSGKRTGNNALNLSGARPQTRRGGKRSNKTRRSNNSRKY